MSMCFRPVVETWGESFTYLSRDNDIAELLQSIGEMMDDGKGEMTFAVHDYNDMRVVYISDGAAFLDFIERTQPQAILDHLAENEILSSDDEEYQRQRDDITDICKSAPAWRKSIDPQDGSLRFYCD